LISACSSLSIWFACSAVIPTFLASIITASAPCLNASVILVTGVFRLVPFNVFNSVFTPFIIKSGVLTP